ncbi:hypothetical protein O181_064197 [Austropuccinia psidii MF-1]|uniref:Uncharacterized protein n=1 Tax=Austropuccinia psidii MF-1 TaxID=1389203 RepID=A0A9Q3ER15_9BASI|nr:hypothetical protein [Austropuccinia psidii MF-1]
MTHWLAHEHIAGYFMNYCDKCLKYEALSSELLLWIDASRCGDHASSTLGFLIKAYGNPIAWNLQWKPVVAILTFEAEYVTLSDATKLLAVIQLIAIQINPILKLSIKWYKCAAI